MDDAAWVIKMVRVIARLKKKAWHEKKRVSVG